MEKAKIKQPFGPWSVGQNLFRATGSQECIRIILPSKSGGKPPADFMYGVRLRDGEVTYGQLLGQFSTVSEAIAFADNYIADNFEVEKPVEERLKDAEQEIIVLKVTVAELRDDRGYKFKIGQKVRRVHDSYTAAIFTRKQVGTNNESKYQLSYNNGATGSIWWSDSELNAV